MDERAGVRRQGWGRGAGVGVGEDGGDGDLPLLHGDRGGSRAWHEPLAHRAGSGRDTERAAHADPRAARDAALPGPSPQPHARHGGRSGGAPGRARVLSQAAAGARAGGLRGAAGARPPGARHQPGEALGREVRLGVISDTHGLLRPEVFELFKQVDYILHAGDVGRPEILIELEAIAPVTAVYGNSDGSELRARLPQVAELELDGFAVVVTHGDQFGHPTPENLHAAFPRAEIIVYGHTHKPLLELVDRTVTVMNPGGAGHPRVKLNPGVGIMELEAGIPPPGGLVPPGRTSSRPPGARRRVSTPRAPEEPPPPAAPPP